LTGITILYVNSVVAFIAAFTQAYATQKQVSNMNKRNEIGSPNNLWGDRRATTAIITALLLPVLIGFVGLGLDTANWYSNHRQMERIAESAASAAAPLLSNTSNTTAMITAVANNDAVLNGLSPANGDSVTVNVAADRSSVTVTGSRPLNQFFSGLFMASAPTTTAVAQAKPSGLPVCLLVTSLLSTQAMNVAAGATLNIPACEADIASLLSNAVTFAGSLPNVGKMCVAGVASLLNGATINNLVNNCTPALDPYTNKIPLPTLSKCDVVGGNYSGTVNLKPGTYCGSFNWNGAGTLNLAPGLYALASGVSWTITSAYTISGSGVTFFFEDSSSYVDFAGSTVNLSAPTSGPYANILAYETPGLISLMPACTGAGCFNITGTGTGNVLSGVLDLPSRNLALASSLVSANLTIITNTMYLFKNGSLTLSPSNISITKTNGNTFTAGTLVQ
jgi:Flp pilus assembly protein TadG